MWFNASHQASRTGSPDVWLYPTSWRKQGQRMTSNEITAREPNAEEQAWQTFIEFALPAQPGNERLVVERVTEAIGMLNWAEADLAQLKRALAQATHKALEQSRRYNLAGRLRVRVMIQEDSTPLESDQAGAEPREHQMVERRARPISAGPSRGWGFFIVEKVVKDAGRTQQYRLELFLYPGAAS